MEEEDKGCGFSQILSVKKPYFVFSLTRGKYSTRPLHRDPERLSHLPVSQRTAQTQRVTPVSWPDYQSPAQHKPNPASPREGPPRKAGHNNGPQPILTPCRNHSHALTIPTNQTPTGPRSPPPFSLYPTPSISIHTMLQSLL